MWFGGSGVRPAQYMGGGRGLLLACVAAVAFLWTMLACRPAWAEPEARTRDVSVGVYLQRLHAISLKDNTFTVDIYLWFRWKPEDFPKSAAGESEGLKLPFDTFEIVGSSSVEKVVVSQTDGYACLRVKVQLTQFWKVDSFPFDNHVLSIVVEDSASEVHLLKYAADVTGSSVSPDFEVPGWLTQPLQVNSRLHEYRTSFGDPNLPTGDSATYGQVSFDLPVVRRGYGMFLKLFTGLFVSVAIAFVAFFVRASEVDPRFGLPVGALFAAVASEYVVASSLPDSAAVTLADRLHLVSFVAILAVVVESARALHLIHSEVEGVEKRVNRLDRRTFMVVGTTWMAVVAFLVFRARG